MSLSANSFTAYMSEKVSVARWDRFWQFFILLFLIYAAITGSDQLFNHPGKTVRHILLSFSVALLISATGYWKDRYGSRFERAYIVFLVLVILVLLTIIVRHEVERHWRNSLRKSDSTPQTSACAIQSERPTTNDQRLTL